MRFSIEQQQENEWCWDAVAVSVEHYFNPHSTLTQKDFAVRALGVPLSHADKPWYLQDALSDIRKLEGNPQGYLSFAQIKRQIDANLPVCVHVAWKDGGSHCVVISGYGISPGRNPQVHVSDPILPDSNLVVWDYEAFLFAYDPSYAPSAEGAWIDTCLVTPREEE